MSTFDSRRFVFIAHAVLALSIDEIVSGNIILEVATRPEREVTADELAGRIRIRPRYSTAGIQIAELAKAQEQNLSALTIDPSYGADALILARSFELLTFEEWRTTWQVVS